ncbi:MAG: DUF4962 domain-containing protein, partial [Armatimonadota bacterium]|nr:DUF4962 domain-containing protein [Armatimonadota bacterium]
GGRGRHTGVVAVLPAGPVGCQVALALTTAALLAALPGAWAVNEAEPGPLEAPITPADGSAPRRNPPAFVWRPDTKAASYTLQLSPSPRFEEETTQTFEGLRLNLHNPPRRLQPGTWYWRWRAVSASGEVSGWSRSRTFQMGPEAFTFEVPPLPELAKRIPADHPRLFATKQTLAQFRARRLGPARTVWESLESSARRAIGAPLPAEPEPYKDGKWEVTQWRNIWNIGEQAADQMERQAFAYLVSGDRAFADEARRWMLHVCSWNPAGTTSHQYNDMASRPILYKMARAYDWVSDTLSPEERARVLEVLRIRGGELFQMLQARRLEERPFDSHLISALEFMGEVALALYGDLPEARTWFEYAIPLHLAIFPPWGGEDGGWSQGVSYWKWSTYSALLYADALRSALGLDVFQKPWYRATGFFKLYCHPPYSRMSAFGDHSDVPPDATDRANMERLGSVYKEGAFKWYAARVPGTIGGIAGYLWNGDDTPARPPADLPPSRLFADVGIAALHTRLWDAANNVTLLLKSSPYGSYNHGYAEQNNFVLDAFGEPLVISSGYYPWYMSPHHKEWTHQTKAQNCLLVDGKGQPLQDKKAVGRIAAFHAGEGYDYVVGDASAAYPGSLHRCLRRVLFLRPTLFVMLDDAAAPAPASFQWMLHSLEEMAVDQVRRAAVIRRGSARLSVRWLEPARLTFSQTDQFPVAPEEREAHKPNQWHLTVSTMDRAETVRFLTLLAPYRVGEEGRVPPAERLAAPGVLGVRVADETAGFRLPEAEGVVSLDGVSADGEAFAVRRSPSGTVTRALLANGRALGVGGVEYLSLRPAASASWRTDGDRVWVRLDLPERGEAALRLTSRPYRVTVDGLLAADGTWSWNAETQQLVLHLPAGSARVEVNGPGDAPLPEPPVLETPGPGETGAPSTAAMSLLRTFEGNLLAYAWLSSAAGPYLLEASPRARVQVGGKPLGQGTVLWLGGGVDLTVESAPGEMPAQVRLKPVP